MQDALVRTDARRPDVLGVEAKSLSEVQTQSKKLSALTGRLNRGIKSDREARAIGRDLAAVGLVSAQEAEALAAAGRDAM